MAPAAPQARPGAGKSSYVCPPGANVVVQASDDLELAVAAAKANDILCIHGEHRIQNTLQPKSGQRWIGIGDARISGAVKLAGFTKSGAAWVTSALPSTTPHKKLHYAGATLCYPEAEYQDDVFIRKPGGDSQRLFRVLSLTELTQTGPLADGLLEPSVSAGRFFFDYANGKLYLSVDPTGAEVDLAVVDVLIGQTPAPTGLVLQNLTLEKALSVGILANNGKEYTLEDLTVRFVHNRGLYMPSGTSAAKRSVLRGSLITNNGQYGIDSTANWLKLEGTEISHNNIAGYRDKSGTKCTGYFAAGAVKFVKSNGAPGQPGLWLDGVDSHDNVGDGFWTDVHNRHVLVENSHFHHNERHGYFHEISCEIELRNSTLNDNGKAIMTDLALQGQGLYVSDASNGNFHHNLIYGNAAGGVRLELVVGHDNMQGVACISPPPANATDTSNALMGNQVHDNQIYACNAYAAGADDNVASGLATLLAPRNNTFSANQYHVADSGNHWIDVTPKNAAAWASVDKTGQVVTGCDHP
ncbi:MAG: right-handed parallel beta-helix repeat-containing protein [Polyangiaceae bacterium]